MKEFTFLVSKTIKYQWTYTLKARSFEEAEQETIHHVKHGEMPRGVDCVCIGCGVVPVIDNSTYL
jgi:hypothetical protein